LQPIAFGGSPDPVGGSDGENQLVRFEAVTPVRTSDVISTGTNNGSGGDTYFANTREHVDGWTEVADMEHREDELDVSIMTSALIRVFMACRTLRCLLVWSLLGVSDTAVVPTDRRTRRPSKAPFGAVALSPFSLLT
jgi:hypothetical protein